MVPLTLTAVIYSDPLGSAHPLVLARVSQVVRKTIFDGTAYAIQHCPVESGNLKGSIHPWFDDAYHGGWGTDVEYAPHVNYGTVKMAARPFMTDSREFVRPSFIAAMKEIAKPL